MISLVTSASRARKQNDRRRLTSSWRPTGSQSTSCFAGSRRSTDAFLLWSDLVHQYEDFSETEVAVARFATTEMGWIMHHSQEAVIDEPFICLAVRERVGRWHYIQIHTEEMHSRELTGTEFLEIKERLAAGMPPGERYVLEIDLSPFERGFPKLRDAQEHRPRASSSLNRHLSGRLFVDGDRGQKLLFDFLQVHQVRGQQLMLNGTLKGVDELREAVEKAMEVLDGHDERERRRSTASFAVLDSSPVGDAHRARSARPWSSCSTSWRLRRRETSRRSWRRMPMVFSIAIVSPHGYFGQSNVLGKPDTGGQIVYILDQVRALEREMRESIRDSQGLDIEPQIVVLTRLIPEADGTTCDQRVEPILGTENARILRVPFRTYEGGETIPQWISRFEVWPYLERYSIDAERELLVELGGVRPDIVIGNYSDGNLVASILAHRLGCHAVQHRARAWKRRSTCFPISIGRITKRSTTSRPSSPRTSSTMNTADFIITSTYQEIAGTRGKRGAVRELQRLHAA